ncbi:DUF397 domain-containing protein [Streptomyces sp. DSM 44915]|uniref:DUF397 domain-containing protein n=1 Tax=Streptomyces chisholmiae TaxID=3075540 RepID=A0ABU2JLD1_9ACTN|nr:DUF397 domain-containing protein [Streptomyces sp. DSM 44915]MDT0265796.1 DUF397 domain-containing protein [Streptomyces sp. DSM 44915]
MSTQHPQELDQADWFTSSYSNNQGGDCVEGARLSADAMAIRDTKDRTRATFVFPTPTWTTFVTAVRSGDLPQ